eukprot:gnl/MRDRNA2_/MRDRNA2_98549_c0_seq1.p1 gnl/MRDRNA2_/MRDRNA2_98549_c0~~gnl/MRDRNA2_/MRDRNA2_98549_c0_seq1.p1  ORF type:complete len:132 (-),score=28.08 gnl/MRDRNA2_/MRDRNA2_98549_c0_seq1:63-458(-)
MAFFLVIRRLACGLLLPALAMMLQGCMGGGKTATASHILVKELSKCNELKSEIAAGADFAEVAKKWSTCPSGKKGGSLGHFSQGQMVPAFDKVIFDPDTQLGDVSDCVKTQFGYHLIQVHKRDMNDKKDEE